MFLKNLIIPFFNRIEKEEARKVIENDLNETWQSCRFTLSHQGHSHKNWCCSRPMVIFKQNSDIFSEGRIFACLGCGTYVNEGSTVRHDILGKQQVQQLKEEFPSEWEIYKKHHLNWMADGIVLLEFPTFEQFLAHEPSKIKANIKQLLLDANLN